MAPEKNTLEMDIVVIGGGGSGLAAAVSASEIGISRIAVLEKKAVLGGNTSLAGGIFAVNSPVQQRMGLNISKDKIFKLAMSYAHWELNSRLIRAWINKTGDTIRWLEEMGVKFVEPLAPWYSGQKHIVYHIFEGRGGKAIKALQKNCESKGIQIFRTTSVKKILTNEQGQVVGIEATDEGKEFIIYAKSVIIATGGFAGNKEMLKKHYPNYNENLVNVGLPHMGDGIRMAIEIGANTEGLGRILGHGPFFTYSYPKSRVLWNVAVQPDVVLVNKNGERYTDEDLPLNPAESLNALNRQPDKIAYCLFDERKKQSFLSDGIIKQVGKDSYPGKKLLDLDEHLQSQINKGNVTISDNWSDIAKWIGTSPETLMNTINEYNSFCARGYDEIFAKDSKYLVPLQIPPFYAIKLMPSLLNTLGGIKVNHHMQVINKHDNPIPGLYAAGVDTGGWSPETYNIMLSGNAISFAFVSGRIAGEKAAEYVRNNLN